MGQQIPSKEVYHGRNFSTESDKFVRCSRCGFICDLQRDQRAPDGSRIGWGITYTAQNVCEQEYNSNETYGGDTDQAYNDGSIYDPDTTYDAGTGKNYDCVDRTIYDPIVHTGCPQCGTLRYDK